MFKISLSLFLNFISTKKLGNSPSFAEKTQKPKRFLKNERIRPSKNTKECVEIDSTT